MTGVLEDVTFMASSHILNSVYHTVEFGSKIQHLEARGVGIVTMLRAGQPKIRASIPGMRKVILPQTFHTGSGTHSVS